MGSKHSPDGLWRNEGGQGCSSFQMAGYSKQAIRVNDSAGPRYHERKALLERQSRMTGPDDSHRDWV
jgi:hypothetical protein